MDLHEEAERLADTLDGNMLVCSDAMNSCRNMATHLATAHTLRALSARLAEVERERDEARARVAAQAEVLEAIYEICVEPAETDHKSVRGWIEVASRNALALPEETDALNRIRAEERERVLDEVSEQWGLAIYGMTENGVRSLNEKAASELHPDIIAFGEWLAAIREDKT